MKDKSDPESVSTQEEQSPQPLSTGGIIDGGSRFDQATIDPDAGSEFMRGGDDGDDFNRPCNLDHSLCGVESRLWESQDALDRQRLLNGIVFAVDGWLGFQLSAAHNQCHGGIRSRRGEPESDL